MSYVMRDGRRIEVVTEDFGIATKSRGKKNRNFVMISRPQFERLITVRSVAALKVFLHLQFLIFKSYKKSAQLTDASLVKNGIHVDPKTKQAALRRLESSGLIRVTRFRHRSPEIVILELPEATP